jgi:hypothetical protein
MSSYAVITTTTGQLTIELDPTDAYPNPDPEAIIQTCGAPLLWALEWYESPLPRALTLHQHLEYAYNFGPLMKLKAARLENNIMYYPGDPPQYPLIKVRCAQDPTVYYQFPRAFICLETPTNQFFTRMD